MANGLLTVEISVRRKPPKPEPQQQHLQRLNFGGGGGVGGGGGGGGPPRKKSSYTRPPLMELETLMEEGAAPLTASADGVGGGGGGDTRAPLANGDDRAPPHDRQQQDRPKSAMKPSSGGADRPHSTLNLMLAACTGQSQTLFIFRGNFILIFLRFFEKSERFARRPRIGFGVEQRRFSKTARRRNGAGLHLGSRGRVRRGNAFRCIG